jgi:hypothetical protein
MKKQIFIMMFVSALLLLTLTVPAMAGSMNGKAGQMPAYYDDTLFTINFKELPPGGEAAVLMHNKSINTIYQSDQAEQLCGFMFVSVLDAIQADGFNPLWQEVQIVFPDCASVVQFTSDNDILAAAAAKQIQLIPTTEVYRCSVVGPGPKKP